MIWRNSYQCTSRDTWHLIRFSQVLSLLLEGATQLGNVIKSNIETLLEELRQFNSASEKEGGGMTASGSGLDLVNDAVKLKGALPDR